ncbi:MAG TPA: flavodoxin family protein [Lutibacter sp.]|nr:flavodoxin family protein [Lutibacter sp.]
MKILIIIANPKIDSFSFAMANKYKELATAKEYEVEIIDLYRTKYQQPFFTYEHANELKITPEMDYYQNKISQADELVFVFPYWWGSMPAILKNFIDWNFSRGFAFEYVNSRPKGLLLNKNVKIFTTTGAPSFIYKITGANNRLKKMFQKQIIEFCGMKLKSFNIYGGVDKSKTKTSDILNKIRL